MELQVDMSSRNGNPIHFELAIQMISNYEIYLQIAIQIIIVCGSIAVDEGQTTFEAALSTKIAAKSS
jgi:hypothetical protein